MTQCRNCDSAGWVCENHADRPWGGTSNNVHACECGAGMPCGACNLEMASARFTHPIREALIEACGLIQSAERETNWVSGDPYGDSETVRLLKIAKAQP